VAVGGGGRDGRARGARGAHWRCRRGRGGWDNPDPEAEAAYAAAYENPLAAVRCGELDAVIPARATRRVLLAEWGRLAAKDRVGHVRGGLRKKDGCIPL